MVTDNVAETVEASQELGIIQSGQCAGSVDNLRLVQLSDEQELYSYSNQFIRIVKTRFCHVEDPVMVVIRNFHFLKRRH